MYQQSQQVPALSSIEASLGSALDCAGSAGNFTGALAVLWEKSQNTRLPDAGTDQ